MKLLRQNDQYFQIKNVALIHMIIKNTKKLHIIYLGFVT